jgi:hypothetical protein
MAAPMTIWDDDRNHICICDRPLLVDETVIFMGVNCFKCGRSAERRLTLTERQEMRDNQRRWRDVRELIV